MAKVYVIVRRSSELQNTYYVYVQTGTAIQPLDKDDCENERTYTAFEATKVAREAKARWEKRGFEVDILNASFNDEVSKPKQPKIVKHTDLRTGDIVRPFPCVNGPWTMLVENVEVRQGTPYVTFVRPYDDTCERFTAPLHSGHVYELITHIN